MRNNEKYFTHAQKITVTAMLTALTLLFLYLAALLPTVRLSFYALSSFFMIGLLLENEISYGWMMFIAVSILGFILIQDKIRMIPYIFFFGIYGIVKYYIEKIRNIILEIPLKLAFFNFSMLILYLIARRIFFSDVKINLPIWMILIVAQFIFLIFDYTFSQVVIFYDIRIRKYIFRS